MRQGPCQLDESISRTISTISAQVASAQGRRQGSQNYNPGVMHSPAVPGPSTRVRSLGAGRRTAVLTVLLLAPFLAHPFAQPRADTPRALTAADYARAERFMTYNTTPLVLHSAG